MIEANKEAFAVWSQAKREHFEQVAENALDAREGSLGTLTEAMRYAVLDGGKRLRALLVYAAGALTQARESDLDELALSVEYVHGYSLVHDDMPAMDNDVLRRGKPTAHVKFGEAVAMLAGDALQPEAFLRIAKTQVDAAVKVRLMQELAFASGRDGMCGGQAIDLLAVGRSLDEASLRRMHGLKTGALILASVRLGALAGKPELFAACEEELNRYAQAIGLAFQVIDDILDVTADTATLGKTSGKDDANDKPTFVSLLGLEGARALAHRTESEAEQALAAIAAKGLFDEQAIALLAGAAAFVTDRKY